MSKNILKKLQSQLQAQNTKLINNLKSDITRTYNSKQKELESFYTHKEQKIKKAYDKFIKKIAHWQESQAKEVGDMKSQLDSINKLVQNAEIRTTRLNKKIDNVKNELRCELRTELNDFALMRGKCEKDIGEMKRKVDNKIVKMMDDNSVETIKDILSSNIH